MIVIDACIINVSSISVSLSPSLN